MRLTWSQPEDLLAHELVQSAAEGLAVDDVAARWAAAGGDLTPPASGAGPAPATPELRRLGRDLLAELADRLTARGPSPAEPDDWAAIEALLPAPPALPHPPAPEDLHRRLLGAWTGRAVGCLLGKPVEKIPRAGIEEILRATGRWPLDRYFTGTGLPDDVARRWPWNRRSAPTSLEETIDGMPEDDDLNYPLLALTLLERHGTDFTTDDVAALWLEALPAGRVFTAERAAYRNLLEARPVPETASHLNPFREWIGALIRADVHGWVLPGDVRGAARLAHTDARLSHTRNGLYGAQWAAALCSAALVCETVDEVLDAAVTVVPPGSRLAEAIDRGRELGRDRDLTAGLDALHAEYGHLHWVHVLNNAATIAWALTLGRGELGPSISAAVTAGWDTDSVGATVGSVVGALGGPERIGAAWAAPVDGRIATSLPGPAEHRIEDLVRRTRDLQERFGTAAGTGPRVDGGTVVVVGSANVDLVVDVPRRPGPGETLLGGALRRSAGGKGANQAVAAARAGGARTSFLGAVGRDDAGDLLLESLRSAGVDTARVARVGTASGTALITVAPDGENSIVVAPGANDRVAVDGADAELLGRADVVLAQLEIPVDAVVAAGRARRPGALLVLNAAPSRELPASLWELVDVLVVNEHEAADMVAALDGRSSAAGADAEPEALAVRLLGRVPAVVVTLGPHGCLVAQRDRAVVAVDAPRVVAVDTTGAGDTFCGVLAAALAQGAALPDAARRAVVAGALAVTRAGAQDAVPSTAEVAAALEEAR